LGGFADDDYDPQQFADDDYDPQPACAPQADPNRPDNFKDVDCLLHKGGLIEILRDVFVIAECKSGEVRGTFLNLRL
jgi:hypothetical protein